MITVFILLNILLSVVMDLFNSIQEQRSSERMRNDLDADGSDPSFSRAASYALMTSTHQLSLTIDLLVAMRPSPKTRPQMRKELLTESGVRPTTVFVLLEALETMSVISGRRKPSRSFGHNNARLQLKVIDALQKSARQVSAVASRRASDAAKQVAAGVPAGAPFRYATAGSFRRNTTSSLLQAVSRLSRNPSRTEATIAPHPDVTIEEL